MSGLYSVFGTGSLERRSAGVALPQPGGQEITGLTEEALL